MSNQLSWVLYQAMPSELAFCTIRMCLAMLGPFFLQNANSSGIILSRMRIYSNVGHTQMHFKCRVFYASCLAGEYFQIVLILKYNIGSLTSPALPLANAFLVSLLSPTVTCSPLCTQLHSVPHNSNSLVSNYRLFRRPPSAPKITPLTQC